MLEPPQPPQVVTDLAAQLRFGDFLLGFQAHMHLRRVAQEVYAYKNGGIFLPDREAISEPTSGAALHMPWDQVAAFVQSVSVDHRIVGSSFTTYTYKFYLRDRSNHELTARTFIGAPSGLERFAGVVDPLITATQLPAMVARIKAGQPISFGLFVLEADGIRIKKQDVLVPWAEIKKISVSPLGPRTGASVATLSLSAKGKKVPYFWPLSSVPNRSAFLALAKLKNLPVR